MKTQFIRLALAFLVLALCSSSFADDHKTVTHVVTEDETAWFLASVYYGKGADYTKLLSINHFQRAEEMKAGMEIKIENPKYSKNTKGFAERYARLWEERRKALGLVKGDSLPNSKVVIPTENIRHRDSTPKLPFAEHKDMGKSAAELAREELLKGSRQSSDKGE